MRERSDSTKEGIAEYLRQLTLVREEIEGAKEMFEIFRERFAAQEEKL